MAQDALTGPGDGAGALLSVLRHGPARTRGELVRITGLARSTVSQRLDALLRQRWVVPAGAAVPSGGRPPTAYTFNRTARLVLAADLGVSRNRVAVTDLGAAVLAERTTDALIDRGPEPTLDWLVRTFTELLAELGRDLSDVCGAGLGLPGPVEHSTGQPVSPPIMPGWGRFPVPERLSERLGTPVLVDNDVNIMALGEHWADPRFDQLLFVKIGTGIGCGVICGGRLYRGAQGAAGDIGHIRAPTAGEDVLCRCGNVGCLEAVAGGAALAARLAEAGLPATAGHDVARLLRAGEPEAARLVQQAGREIGDVLASIVNFFNPSAIVIGGDIASAGEHVLAGIREVIYRRSLPLATQHLRIQVSRLGDRAGITGAAVMVIEHVLAADAVDRVLAL